MAFLTSILGRPGLFVRVWRFVISAILVLKYFLADTNSGFKASRMSFDADWFSFVACARDGITSK